MSPFLNLFAETLDRASNPSFGNQVNEEAAYRIEEALADERFALLLEGEPNREMDVSHLSTFAWTWLLETSLSKRINFAVSTLYALYQSTSDVTLKSLVLRIALDDAKSSPLLSKVVEWTRELRDDEQPWSDERADQPFHVRRAESTLEALMQTGRYGALEAARNLLTDNWPGRAYLNDYFDELIRGVDAETATLWREVIGESRGAV